MLDITPDPILIQLGPISVYWYGICYAIGLIAVYIVATYEARRKGLDDELVVNGMIIIAIAALIGGRAYHVIDQWNHLYASDPIKVFLPPYTGLGVYGGLITGTIAGVAYARWKRQSIWAWADVIAPALFAMQMIGRWGNFFNQELYGPPTSLPWGIPIQCVHRIAAYPCTTFPFETTRFIPLFLYESISGLVGLVVLLFLARRAGRWLRSGDLLGIFFIWYAVVRFILEALRADNWTFNGIPTAWIFSAAFIVAGAAILVVRHVSSGPSIAADDAARLAVVEAAREAQRAAEAEDEDEDWDEDWDADEPWDDDGEEGEAGEAAEDTGDEGGDDAVGDEPDPHDPAEPTAAAGPGPLTKPEDATVDDGPVGGPGGTAAGPH